MRIHRSCVVNGSYGRWEMRLYYDDLVGQPPEPASRQADPERLWPAAKFDRLDAHFRDLINLHEYSLDADARYR